MTLEKKKPKINVSVTDNIVEMLKELGKQKGYVPQTIGALGTVSKGKEINIQIKDIYLTAKKETPETTSVLEKMVKNGQVLVIEEGQKLASNQKKVGQIIYNNSGAIVSCHGFVAGCTVNYDK